MDIRNQIVDSIIDIQSDNISIDISNIKLDYSINKYASIKNNIYHILLNNKQLSRHDKYVIKYKCITCNNIHTIGIIQFLRKLNKGSLCCYLCRNTFSLEEKLLRTRNTNRNIDNNIDKIKKESNINLSVKELRNKNIELFHTYDDDFKDKYFSFHLTEEDYNRISKNIISFHNNNLNDISNYEYWSIFKSSNQMIFTSIMYNKIDNTVFKAHQPIMKCDICLRNWRAKSIERFKNTYKIMCNECLCVNKTYKIRQYKNCINEPIIYQSKLELKFINWCNNNNIIVMNGPKILYKFDNKERTYKVDFQINKYLIEIKDNHIWHRNEIDSGKWQAKEQAAYNLIESNNEKYNDFYFINPINWVQQLNKLLKSIK